MINQFDNPLAFVINIENTSIEESCCINQKVINNGSKSPICSNNFSKKNIFTHCQSYVAFIKMIEKI